MTSADRDDPQAYLPGDRRRALAAGRELPERVHGAALFADVSGFTPLTALLVEELGPQRGAEELTAVLDRVVGPVLAEVARHGGDVLYFSGDAVTAWLDGDDGLRAAACALALQQAVGAVAEVRTPSGGTVRLGLKVAVAVGPARRFVVGDPRVQLLDVLAGSLMDELAAAEQRAASGDVVLAGSAVAALGARVVRDGALLVGLAAPVDLPPVEALPAALPEDVVRQWLLPAVYARMRQGRGEFLAELRPAVPLFLRFGGLDFDADPGAPRALADFVVRAQRVVDGYGGSTLQITVGDKGAYLYAVFGSPLAHEDDAARACAAALDLLALEGETAVGGLQVGIARGLLRSGTYGSRDRRTFCCLGDAVNLAARLMAAAPAGQAYVDEQVRDGARAHAFRALPDLRLKGKHGVRAHALTGRAAVSRVREQQRLVGRGDELRRVGALAERAASGRGQVVAVVGEAGTGKTRLVTEVLAGLLGSGGSGGAPAEGAAQGYGAASSYGAWQPVWRALLGVAGEPDPPALAAHLAAMLPPELAPRAPLLGALLGVPLPDSGLTATFDAKLRKTSLESLAVQLLAALGPRTLVLEDCHWLDPLSRDLLEVVVRAVPGLPVLLLLTSRDPVPAAHQLVLDRLSGDDTRAVVLDRLTALLGRPDPGLVEVVATRSEGNPLYVRELCAYVAEHGGRADGLPTSLASLVLSRIDTLAEQPRRTAKVASVVGRAFAAPLVLGAHPDLGDAHAVEADLQALSVADVVGLEEPAEQRWAFTHAMTREVAYDSLPFALRARLHERIAAHVEAGGDPERRLDLLAHHYGRSDNTGKKRHYLLRAGRAAQAGYANETALEHFRAVLPLLAEQEQGDVLLRTGKLLELAGDRTGAQAAYEQALQLARTRQDRKGAAWARTWLAEVARKRGRYDEAAEGMAVAAAEFAELGDDAGAGQVLQLAGTLAAQQGAYEDARSAYGRSLVLRERTGDLTSAAGVLSNLGIVEEYARDYPAARGLLERAFALYAAAGHRSGMGVTQNNLGMIALLEHDPARAREHFARAVVHNTEVGDRWMTAITDNNLGNASRELGDLAAAGAHYADALRGYRTSDDAWALAILYEDVALLALRAGTVERGLHLVGAADALRERLGSPRPDDVAEQLARAVPPGSGGPVAAGRALSAQEADAEVLAVCGRS